MQSAFVLCRLFKKQDESIEHLNGDEAELAVSSPTTAKSSPEDTQSEVALDPASPPLGVQAKNNEARVDCSPAENSVVISFNAVAPVKGNSNDYMLENKVAELPEVRKKLIDCLE